MTPMIADPMDSDPTRSPNPVDGIAGVGLTRWVCEAIAADTPAGVTLVVHAAPDGGSITLDYATGARLSDAADEAASAALLLQLCAGLDDADLRIGLTGEYDQVHLFRMLPTAGLDAAELIDIARSLAARASGLQALIAAQPRPQTP